MARRNTTSSFEPSHLLGLGNRIVGLSEDEQKMFDAVIQAVSERRLAPGVKLAEEQLSDVFGLNRARIRKVLLILSQRRIVRLEPNKGAFVARPSAKETRDVFQARRLLEAEVVRLVATLPEAARAEAVGALRAHCAAEHAAVAAGDRARQVRLSGDFHLKLADLAGNEVFVTMLRDLIAQMSLALAAYATSTQLDCSLGEHAPIVAALAEGNATVALALSMEHLDHIEATLTVTDRDGGVDLAAVFVDIVKRSGPSHGTSASSGPTQVSDSAAPAATRVTSG